VCVTQVCSYCKLLFYRFSLCCQPGQRNTVYVTVLNIDKRWLIKTAYLFTFSTGLCNVRGSGWWWWANRETGRKRVRQRCSRSSLEDPGLHFSSKWSNVPDAFSLTHTHTHTHTHAHTQSIKYSTFAYSCMLSPSLYCHVDHVELLSGRVLMFKNKLGQQVCLMTFFSLFQHDFSYIFILHMHIFFF